MQPMRTRFGVVALLLFATLFFSPGLTDAKADTQYSGSLTARSYLAAIVDPGICDFWWHHPDDWCAQEIWADSQSWWSTPHTLWVRLYVWSYGPMWFGPETFTDEAPDIASESDYDYHVNKSGGAHHKDLTNNDQVWTDAGCMLSFCPSP